MFIQANAVYHVYQCCECYGMLESRRLVRCLNSPTIGCSSVVIAIGPAAPLSITLLVAQSVPRTGSGGRCGCRTFPRLGRKEAGCSPHRR